jgi:hypothetical protein
MGMSDANHAVEFMRLLIKNANEIAGLDKLARAEFSVELVSTWGSVNIEWMAKHCTHRLAPVSEYGDLDGECSEKVQCDKCGSWKPCVLPNDHDPGTPHSFKKVGV